jgi:hypothetical protein
MNHVRLKNRVTPNLRDWELLEYCGTPFDRVPHTADVRSIEKRAGKYNVPNVGMHIWRVGSHPLTESPARGLSSSNPEDWRFFVNPLGLDTALFTRPEREEKITHLAEPINIPMPVSRRVLHEHKDRYYGKEKSLAVYEGGVLVEAARVTVSDLSDDESVGEWVCRPLDPRLDIGIGAWVAVDPELGRLRFLNTPPSGPVTVTYHHGFTADTGGGEYNREGSFDTTLQETGAPIIRVPDDADTLTGALALLSSRSGVVEVTRNLVLQEVLHVNAAAGQRVELRAADGCRPVVKLTGDASIAGSERAELIVNGLLVAGQPLRVNGDKTMQVRFVHCTLAPDVRVAHGHLEVVTGPGLKVETEGVGVEVERSIIIGGIEAARDSRVKVSNSIVDAMDETACAFGPVPAVSAPQPPAGRLNAANCTFIGRVHTELIELASNCIFLARSEDPAVPPVVADRLQQGCVRFCFVPPGARVPRQYRCQPALALEKRADELGVKVSDLPAEERVRVVGRVQPAFTSMHYGDYGYGQLSRLCPEEIRRGADDGAEMGLFHDLYQPQRETNLRIRLQEYMRFGLVAGIFYET